MSDYVESWTKRVLTNAPSDETPDDVLALIKRDPFLNRGRWAAYVVRLGEAQRREESWQGAQDVHTAAGMTQQATTVTVAGTIPTLVGEDSQTTI